MSAPKGLLLCALVVVGVPDGATAQGNREIGKAYVVADAEDPVKAKGDGASEPEPNAQPGDAPSETPTPETAVTPRDSAFFRAIWNRRVEARAKGDEKLAQEITQVLLKEKAASGWPSMAAYGGAIALEIDDHLAKGDGATAAVLAHHAVELAPFAPSVRLAQLRALWMAGKYFDAGQSGWSALAVAYADPPLRARYLGNLLLSLGTALILVTFALGVITFFKYRTLALHDFELVLAGPAWAHSIIWVVLAMVPWVIAGGPAGLMAGFLGAGAIYMSGRERAVAVLLVTAVAAFVLFLPDVSRHFAYPGSEAQHLHDLAVEVDADPKALKAPDSAEALYARGLRRSWAGQGDEAIALLRKAAAKHDGSASLFTALGNAEFTQGRDRQAIKAYEKAIELDPSSVVAHYNLSRAYYSIAEHRKANAAHRTATSIDFERVEGFSKIAKQHGPKFVVPQGAPRDLLSVPPAKSEAHVAAIDDIWKYFGGLLARVPFAIACGLLVFWVGLVVLMRRPLKISSGCPRCGSPISVRTHPRLPDLKQCGWCHEAFGDDARDEQLRIRQEIAAHRFMSARQRTARFMSALVPGAGYFHRGRAFRGALLMLMGLTGLVIFVSVSGLARNVYPLTDAMWRVPNMMLSGACFLLCYGVSLFSSIREG